MAFNNPSSTKPVSYASATKSLGYLCRAVANACSREEDGEDAHLLRKKKSSQENRTMVATMCTCLCCLVGIVVLFVLALLHLTYPHPVPQGVHSLGGAPPKKLAISHLSEFRSVRKGKAARGRLQGKTAAQLDGGMMGLFKGSAGAKR
mmetsp:Transcript_44248/g.108156  ORF Transcript_44248/g.108156 Transcript_44248/m.108156 type:complete len:148 (-) Transcript_44248:5-448(-)